MEVDCYSLETTFEDSSDWSAMLEVLNLLLRAINSSFEGGAGLSAIVRANDAGSLPFKGHHDRDLVVILLDFHKLSIPFLCTLVVFSGKYLLPCPCRCPLLVQMKIPVYGCKLFPGLVNFVTKTMT